MTHLVCTVGTNLGMACPLGKEMTAGKMAGGSNVKRRNVSRGRAGLESGAVSGKKPSTSWQLTQRFAKALIKARYFAPTYFWTCEPAKGLNRHFLNQTCCYWMGNRVLAECSLWTAKWGCWSQIQLRKSGLVVIPKGETWLRLRYPKTPMIHDMHNHTLPIIAFHWPFYGYPSFLDTSSHVLTKIPVLLCRWQRTTWKV